jgi:hypothetical protein
MSLVDYLPDPSEVTKCIKPVAEGAHEAVLLAVHQPTPLSYRLVHGNEIVATDEAALLAHILTDDIPTGALVVPITGASGAGKSHLVRIIEARLRNGPSAATHLIIRVPKSASLRSVVELILQPLPDDEYAAVKSAFKNALAEVDVQSAAIRFQGELEIALGRLASDLREKSSHTPTQALREQLDHANRLPLLLRDPVTSQHFRESVFPRIVKRAVSGGDGTDDPMEGQFRIADLELPDDVDLGQAGRPVSNYYRVTLQSRGGQGKVAAVEVLNAVVDQATRQLFSLNEALGGMTLQDVILEIRRRLLQERRDLILLVEDFAALTGIQETLARVLIQEGIRDGKAEFATMRSVIAVTDGYLVSRDTLATRAMREWIVESRIESDEEIFARTTALVAAYLNAARWTEAELISRFDSRTNRADTASSSWLPAYRANDDEMTSVRISAFGFSDEIPLFPFSDRAIRHLARRALTHGDALVFNPRFIISEVLRRVLPRAKDAYLENRFPPVGIEARKPSAEVAAWIASLKEADAVRRRYEVLVVVWGDSPTTLSDVGQIPGPIFEAFGLRAPELGNVPRPRSPKAAEPAQPAPLPAAEPNAREVERYRAAFEDWVQGGRLAQTIANDVRKNLAAAINEQIDWNAEHCVRMPLQADCISIPNARGEEGLQANPIKIAEDSSDREGQLRNELLSLIRLYEVHGRDERYVGFDDDLVRVATLVERLLPQARHRLRSKVLEQLDIALPVLAGNSRILGLSETGRTSRALFAFIFGAAPAQETLPESIGNQAVKPAVSEWRDLQSKALVLRPRLIELLLKYCGCFQGTGDTPYGVDLVRVAEHYPGSEGRIELSKLEGLGPDERNVLSGMTAVRVAVRFRGLRMEAVRLRDVVTARLGDEFDKDAISTQLKNLAGALREVGAWDSEAFGMTQPSFTGMCETFRASGLREALDQLARSDKLDGGSDPDKLVPLRIGPLILAVEFIRASDTVVTAAVKRANTLEQQVAGIDPKTVAQRILDSFATIERDLQAI